jgi:hypothetical protein
VETSEISSSNLSVIDLSYFLAPASTRLIPARRLTLMRKPHLPFNESRNLLSLPMNIGCNLVYNSPEVENEIPSVLEIS